MRYSTNIICYILVFSLLRCAGAINLDKQPPAEFTEVYYQGWNGGAQEFGSGINLYIELANNTVLLDSAFFRGKSSKLIGRVNTTQSYIASFSFDRTISEKPRVPSVLSFPFILNDNECVVSYIKGESTHYFKISNIEEREAINYPSVQSN